jgi:hypothetical protein
MTRRALLVCFLLCACSSDEEVALEDNPLCKFDCPERGVAEGNAAISGVPAADTLFRAAVDYTTAADAASAAIEAELAQLRVDFGLSPKDALGAKIRSQGADALGKSPAVVAHRAACWIDSLGLLDIQAQCSGEPATAEAVPCRGPCRVPAGTDCSVSADSQCTQNMAGGECSKDCTGTCTDAPDPSGGCDGTCLGACDGACDAFAKDADGDVLCAGRCAGRCTGQCARPIDHATCRGTCDGTCTSVNPKDGCDDAVEQRCQGKSGRPFDGPGACGGTVELSPAGDAECRAAAQAQASYLAHCDAPRVSVVRAPAPSAQGDREQRYLRALRGFEQRLPELLAAVARGELVKAAGQKLATLATTDVKESLEAQSKAADLPIQTRAGLTCAMAEAPKVGAALEPATRRLDAALADADELLGAFDID